VLAPGEGSRGRKQVLITSSRLVVGSSAQHGTAQHSRAQRSGAHRGHRVRFEAVDGASNMSSLAVAQLPHLGLCRQQVALPPSLPLSQGLSWLHVHSAALYSAIGCACAHLLAPEHAHPSAPPCTAPPASLRRYCAAHCHSLMPT
jgi:hypothetical protein